MARKTSSATANPDGFSWVQVWAAYRKQAPEIQYAWIYGYGGMEEALLDAMQNYPKDVQDEILGFAPAEIQKDFGYKQQGKSSGGFDTPEDCIAFLRSIK